MCSAPGDLPGDLWCSCLFAFIVNECDCCFRQICRCHFGLLFARRFAASSLPALLCNVFKCAYLDVFYLCLLLVLSICYLQISVRMRHVTFADYYLRTNIEFRSKACTRGKYYSYTGVKFSVVRIYICVQAYIRASCSCSGSS